MTETRVLVVEDEPLIAEDIAMCLTHNDFFVSGIAYTEKDALAELKNNTPDIVLLDINLAGDAEGISIAATINSRYSIPFIYITSYSDRQTLKNARATEPFGYIVKPFTEAGIYAAIEIALYNHAQKNKSNFPELKREKINQGLPVALSEREFEVMQLIADGQTNQQIAESIFVSVNTIKKHISSCYLKLDVNTRTTALARLKTLMMK